MEFLIGRSLANNVMNLMLDPTVDRAFGETSRRWIEMLERGAARDRMDDACARLAKNHGMMASFSRALAQDLKHSMTDAEFDKELGEAVNEIYEASTVKV